jgi:hypothetical protein
VGGSERVRKKIPPGGEKMESANPRESIFGRKIRLGGSADRTGPAIRQFLERGPWFDSIFRVSHSRVVNIPANGTGILFHIFLSFLVFFSPVEVRVISSTSFSKWPGYDYRK